MLTQACITVCDLFLLIYISSNYFLLFQAGSFYGSTIKSLYPIDPHDSDEDSEGPDDLEVLEEADAVLDQYIAEALSQEVLDEEEIMSPPQKKRKGNYRPRFT